VLARRPEGAAFAAQLLGAADQVLARSACGLLADGRAMYERVLETVRARLGEEYQAAWTSGASMPLEHVIANVHQAMLRAGAAPLSLCDGPLPESTGRRGRYPGGLTKRELVVLRLLAHGLTYDQIAEQLVISPRTVNRHLTSIYSKLGVSSRHAATRWALANDLVQSNIETID
jgi:DNA-binding NarL/FixJ family response regulator